VVSVEAEALFDDEAPWEYPQRHRLRVWAEHLDTLEPKGQLVSLPLFKDRINLYPHQVNAAMRVLAKMGARAILADEVGLGKTIEAGIALKELLERGLAQTVLILTPSNLVGQWRVELEDKFGETFVTHEDADFQGFDAHDRVIASIDTAKLEENAARILGRDWDLLIVDEAHYLKSRSTLRYELVSKIESKYFLALTATPIQNNLRELFNLIHLVRPGLLGSARTFDRRFLADSEGRRLQNVSELQERLREVIIRNRRKETGLDFPPRIVKTSSAIGNEKEYELHDELRDFIAKQYESQGFQLSLLLLQREMASSPQAVIDTLRRMQASSNIVAGPEIDELVKLAESLRKITKMDLLEKLARSFKTQFLVYTQFRRTQELLVQRFKKLGLRPVSFHGELSPGRRRNALEEFRKGGDVLVLTDSGSEGLNLQFAHVVVNYDLPWNPMRVEQRIGRVHRIGQASDVLIVNLSIKDTVEDYVLKVLYDKIRLFEVAIGEMDLILSELESGESLERQVFEILAQAKTRAAQKRKLSNLKRKLEKGVVEAEQVKKFDAEIFSQFDLGTVEGA
jgi:SNF2 family DNA or RNA helicase